MSWPEFIVQIEPHEDGELFHMRREPKEIVRCRDCKHLKERKKRPNHVCDYGVEYWGLEPDGFCAWGERRSE